MLSKKVIIGVKMNEFQERLYELLKDNNLNRLSLSKKIGINSRAVDDYFNRDFYPSIKTAKKMASYFDCSLDYLFGRSDEKRNNNKNKRPFFDTFKSLLQDNKILMTHAMNEMGMRPYNYYRWQKGVFPKSVVLLQIADYFEVSIDFLVGYTNL